MNLYILRHGDASFDVVKKERALSIRGAEESQAVVQRRLSELSDLDLIVCSPVLRARQTLSAIQKELAFRAALTIDDCVRSESSIDAVADFLEQISAQRILLISHQPLVGQLVDYLSGEQHLGYQMGTSCLAAFSIDHFARGFGDLLWMELI